MLLLLLQCAVYGLACSALRPDAPYTVPTTLSSTKKIKIKIFLVSSTLFCDGKRRSNGWHDIVTSSAKGRTTTEMFGGWLVSFFVFGAKVIELWIFISLNVRTYVRVIDEYLYWVQITYCMRCTLLEVDRFPL